MDLSDPKQHSWRQGALVPRSRQVDEAISGIVAPAQLESADVLLIASQDCDICSYSFEDEPTIELIVGRLRPQDGNLQFGKNPRKLQVPCGAPGSQVWYQLQIRERCHLDRRILASLPTEISPGVDVSHLATFRNWLAKRYSRAAFPTALNERLSEVGARNRLLKKLKGPGALITGIYVSLNTWNEQPPGDTYEVDIRLTVTRETWESIEQRRLATEAVRVFEDVLGDCPGVDFHGAKLVPEHEFTIADLNYFRRFDDTDSLSMKDEGGSIPPSA